MAKINFKPVASLLVIARQLSKTVALTLGLIVFSFLFVWYIFAWTEPTAVPPGGNVLAPLNVGPDAQAKEGMLWLAYNPAVTTGLIVEYGNVGIGTSSPDYSLHIVNPSDTRNKMFFDSSKGAFRAGYASTDEWDDVNIGSKSIAMGLNTTASGPWSIAIGRFSTAVGQASAAIGEGATASGAQSIAIGVSNTASGTNSTAIGAGTTASGFNSMALGVGTVAGGHHSVAISNWIDVMGDYSVGIALDNAASYVITQDNTMAIMGGNVGIGTSSPGKKLDVVGGEIRSDAGLCITGASPECISDWPAGGGGFWAVSGVDDIYNTNTGNVGIGITNPGNTLTILSPDMGGGSNGVTLNVNTTNWDDAFYRFGHDGFALNRGLYYDSAAGRISIWVDQERLSVLSNGNVGIGTTSPSQKLDVVGGHIRSDTGFCIDADCINSWSHTHALDKEVVVGEWVTVNPGVDGSAWARCPLGKIATGGGCGANYHELMIQYSEPSFPRGWFCYGHNNHFLAVIMRAVVVCVAENPPGY